MKNKDKEKNPPKKPAPKVCGTKDLNFDYVYVFEGTCGSNGFETLDNQECTDLTKKLWDNPLEGEADKCGDVFCPDKCFISGSKFLFGTIRWQSPDITNNGTDTSDCSESYPCICKALTRDCNPPVEHSNSAAAPCGGALIGETCEIDCVHNSHSLKPSNQIECTMEGWADAEHICSDPCEGKNCSGHGTCTDGNCECESNDEEKWTGEDCETREEIVQTVQTEDDNCNGYMNPDANQTVCFDEVFTCMGCCPTAYSKGEHLIKIGRNAELMDIFGLGMVTNNNGDNVLCFQTTGSQTMANCCQNKTEAML